MMSVDVDKDRNRMDTSDGTDEKVWLFGKTNHVLAKEI
jgi:hypothetical protein